MSRCRSCGARIAWIETEGGKKHPIDATPEYRWINGKGWKLVETYQSHFVTCPQSKEWSKKTDAWKRSGK